MANYEKLPFEQTGENIRFDISLKELKGNEQEVVNLLKNMIPSKIIEQGEQITELTKLGTQVNKMNHLITSSLDGKNEITGLKYTYTKLNTPQIREPVYDSQYSIYDKKFGESSVIKFNKETGEFNLSFRDYSLIKDPNHIQFFKGGESTQNLGLVEQEELLQNRKIEIWNVILDLTENV